MGIVAFPGRRQNRAEPPVRDWSQQEIADFYRAHRLLAENGAAIGIDRGVSDEGEPWMVFYDTVGHDVFLHIARIDGVCHLICEPFNMVLRAPDITALVAQFEHAVRDYLSIRSERAKNVIVHPAARIIMSISAVFLLFKLENGEAYAKGPADKAGPVAGEARGGEKSAALVRAQSAFSRAFDTADAPANAALLAGIILAGELSLKSLRELETPAPELGGGASAVHAAPADVSADPLVAKADPAPDAVAPAPPPVSVDAPLVETVVPDLAASAAPVALRFTPPEMVVRLPPPASDAPAVPPFVALPVEAPPPAPEAPAEEKADMVKLVRTVVDLLDLSAVPEGDAGVEKPADIAPIKKPSDISLDRLGEMSTELGFAMEAHLSLPVLYDLMRHYSEVMPDYDFEYRSSGQILIEQQGLEDVADTDIGMFTSVLADGGSFTFVGKVEIIDDALGFL